MCVWWYEERAGVVRDLALCDLTLKVEGKLGVPVIYQCVLWR